VAQVASERASDRRTQRGGFKMTAPVLTTKLHIPPLLPGLVSRRRLIRRLDEGLQEGHRLILVSAPAGYGKTTLVTEWLRGIQDAGDAAPAVSWLSLDEADSDPARFLSYLIAALQMVDPAIGQTAQAMLRSPQPPPPEPLVTSLINEIAAAPRSVVLVLDDYHLIKALPIHQQLAFLVEHQPAQMRLVIATREDPPLPLARLRARGQTLEIRQDDLRFSREECADFFKSVMALDLSQEDIAALERRTEGWIAGLQLAALSMHGRGDLREFVRAFSGSSRYILDYLVEEVLQRQSPDAQRFLLDTSILDRFSAPLCDAVTGRADSRDVLGALEQANLFIVPLDPSREWYRYHHLFLDLLRHQLGSQAAHLKRPLHQRASQWFEDNGFQAEAVHHALAGKDWERAAALIESLSSATLARGEIATLIGWIRQLPDQVLRARPRLCHGYAWALLLSGQFDAADSLLSHAEQHAPDDPHFLGEVASAQAFLARARGDGRRVVEASRRALSLLPESDLTSRGTVALNLGLTYWHTGHMTEAEPALMEARHAAGESGNVYAGLTAQVFLARIQAVRGALRQAATQCREVIEAGGQIPSAALAHLDLCALHDEWNDLEAATRHLARSVEISRRSGTAEFLVSGEMMRARLQMVQGDLSAALDTARRANEMARDFPPFTRARTAACLVRVALAQGDLDAASRWAEEVTSEADAHTFHMFLGLSRARLLIAQGQKEAAAAELQACFEKAFNGGWGYALIVVRVLQSLIAEPCEAALEFLTDALTRAQPEGYVRAFVDAGEPMAKLLERMKDEGGRMKPYVLKLLAAFKRQDHLHPSALSPQPLTEPITSRELEVLRLLAADLSAREMAEHLVVSVNTIKTQLKSIYAKLDTHSREEALEKARALKLI
jgi:LuxR family maltose regulon positive regulatory protein